MLRLLLSRPLCESEIERWTTPDERAAAAGFAAARRSERLSWRALARRELCRELGCEPAGIAFGYNGVGAPLVEGAEVRIAVSHCAGSIAVALSDAPCAVDIETLDRDFGRAASRFMTSAEWAFSADPSWPALVWCAKETLYKYAGRRELDLLHDLRVENVDFSAAALLGRICGGAPLALRFLFLAGRVVVYLS